MKRKKPSLAEIVSRNIRKARLEAGMTQKELADKAGFKVSYVARLETRPQNLSLGVLERLTESLNLPCSDLMEDDGNKQRYFVEKTINQSKLYKLARELSELLNQE